LAYPVEKLADRRILLALEGHQAIAEVTIVDPARSRLRSSLNSHAPNFGEKWGKDRAARRKDIGAEKRAPAIDPPAIIEPA
jgi:hypothetical protein